MNKAEDKEFDEVAAYSKILFEGSGASFIGKILIGHEEIASQLTELISASSPLIAFGLKQTPLRFFELLKIASHIAIPNAHVMKAAFTQVASVDRPKELLIGEVGETIGTLMHYRNAMAHGDTKKALSRLKELIVLAEKRFPNREFKDPHQAVLMLFAFCSGFLRGVTEKQIELNNLIYISGLKKLVWNEKNKDTTSY